MTIWFIPLWIIPATLFSFSLIGVLAMLFHAHHSLKDRVGTLTPYSEQHATDLQRRVQKIVAVSAEQSRNLTESLRDNEAISAETRAMRAVLDAEAEGRRDADATHHRG